MNKGTKIIIGGLAVNNIILAGMFTYNGIKSIRALSKCVKHINNLDNDKKILRYYKSEIEGYYNQILAEERKDKPNEMVLKEIKEYLEHTNKEFDKYL